MEIYEYVAYNTFNVTSFHFPVFLILLESNNGSGRRKTEEETTGGRAEKIGRTRGRTAPSTRKRTNAETVGRRYAETKTKGGGFLNFL